MLEHRPRFHMLCCMAWELFGLKRAGALFWVSLGCCWYVCGAKVKLDIWELCGSSRRTEGSLDMVVIRRTGRTGRVKERFGGGGGWSVGERRLAPRVLVIDSTQLFPFPTSSYQSDVQSIVKAKHSVSF